MINLPTRGELSVKYVLDCVFHPFDYLFCLNLPLFCLHIETEWSSGNTRVYHTGDPGSIPGRGGSSEKCESI